MGRNHFQVQQQHCGDESMWMESQEQSYGHKQFPGMHMNHNNRLGGFAMDSEHSMQKHHHGHGNVGHHHGHGNVGGMHMNRPHGQGMFQGDHAYVHHGAWGGRKFPFGNKTSHHHFPINGGGHGQQHHEYFSEESEYEESYAEEHVGGVTAKVDEMRYERHNWGAPNPYIKNNINHKFQWTSKGV